ncbi:hypothetical protein Tco_0455123 [Tanacetum coccineum]
MSALNQQTLVESPILGKGNYISWESWFRRFLENKGEDVEKMWYSITKGPYLRPMIPDPDEPRNQIPKPLSKMTDANRKRYTNDVRERIRRLMYGLKKNKNVIYSRLMNELDKFEAKEGESLDSVYERLSTLVNVMDRNDIRPLKVSINTKFLNSLQPEWSKYVTLTPSKANIVAKNHYPLALIAHSNAYSSQSHASSSHSHSPQPYYVTHPSSVVDSKEDYQRKLQRDADRCTDISNRPLYFTKHKKSSSDKMMVEVELQTKMLAMVESYNVQREAENQQRLNIELKKQKELLQKELETCKEWVKTLEFKSAQCSKYKETCDDLEREIRADKDTIERILKE